MWDVAFLLVFGEFEERRGFYLVLIRVFVSLGYGLNDAVGKLDDVIGVRNRHM